MGKRHEYCKTVNNKITKKNIEEWRADPDSFNAYWPRIKEEYRAIEPLLKKDDYILDVGCRNGAFLEILRNNGFAKILGIDLCPEAVEETLLKGIDCLKYDIQEDNIFDAETFDVITMFHTLEHVSDPLLTAKQVHKILKKGGILFIEVPVHAPEPAEDWGHFSIFTDGEQVHKLFEDDFKLLHFSHQKQPTKKPWFRYIYVKVR